MTSPLIRSCPDTRRIAAGLPAVISAIGQHGFDSQLVRYLHQIWGAEHMALMYLSRGQMNGLLTSSIEHPEENYRQMFLYTSSALWRRDPTYDEARDRLVSRPIVAVGTDVVRLHDRTLREDIYGRRGIKHRAVLCSKTDEGMAVLAICSSSQQISARDRLASIEDESPLIFSLLWKHIGLAEQKFDASAAFRSVREIEAVIMEGAPSMPDREIQVCSRALFGKPSADIAVELGIGRESVATYRKRAYSRLGVATQRELVLWYLMLWSEGRGRYLTSRGPATLGALHVLNRDGHRERVS